MKRIALILVGLLAAGVFVTQALGDDGTEAGGDYVVRAYFDSAGFLVEGEDVRIAGATVGSIKDVEVSLPGEPVTEDGSEDPGKAVVVMQIDDPGFQAFLADASCLIRPQSLLGEKYVECDPTEPRAPGSEPPPALERIPEGDIGEGEYALPIENNGKSVDLDLVNNITREPEVERFRLILNELGAGLAARGDDLDEVIKRANPALQETDKVLAVLADQNRELAQLAADSDTILTPLARERDQLAGFIRNASIAGDATASRRADLELSLQRFPAALTELQSTMIELRKFAEQGQPVAQNLNEAAPGLAGATEALRPFSRAGTGALLSLGEATEQAGPDLAASEPVIVTLRKLGNSTLPVAKNIRKLFGTIRQSGGIDQLMAAIVNNSNVFNGFDSFGHYLRAQIQITNCVEYVTSPKSGCIATFGTGNQSAPGDPPSPQSFGAEIPDLEGADADSVELDPADLGTPDPAAPEDDADAEDPADEEATESDKGKGKGGQEDPGPSDAEQAATMDLFTYLMGDGS